MPLTLGQRIQLITGRYHHTRLERVGVRVQSPVEAGTLGTVVEILGDDRYMVRFEVSETGTFLPVHGLEVRPQSSHSPPQRLRGIFRLQDKTEDELWRLIADDRADVLGEKWVLEAAWFMESFLSGGHDEQIVYAGTLDEYFRIVQSLGSPFQTLVGGKPAPKTQYAFRGQNSEYVLTDLHPNEEPPLVFDWKRRFPTFFDFRQHEGCLINLEPGIKRRPWFDSEMTLFDDVGTSLEETFRRKWARRALDRDDVLGKVNRALNRYLGHNETEIRDWWLLEAIHQHYGPATLSLDVTTDPSVALFFATHKYSASGRIATMSRSKGPAVVYCFNLPRDRQVTTHWHPGLPTWLDVDEFELGDVDLRPVRQRGIIFKPGITEGPFNGVELGAFVFLKIILGPDILSTPCPEGAALPSGFDLFPPPETDRLYAELLREGDVFPEYKF